MHHKKHFNVRRIIVRVFKLFTCSLDIDYNGATYVSDIYTALFYIAGLATTLDIHVHVRRVGRTFM